MVRASLRGVSYTIENPEESFAVVRETIPEMTDDEAPTQRQVLDASIELWRGGRPGLSDRQAWQDSVDFMVETGLLENTIAVDELFSNEFVDSR
jgi:ABC-type nitrate/sulfonate/bicarbonate transport system substrate-binding protein